MFSSRDGRCWQAMKISTTVLYQKAFLFHFYYITFGRGKDGRGWHYIIFWLCSQQPFKGTGIAGTRAGGERCFAEGSKSMLLALQEPVQTVIWARSGMRVEGIQVYSMSQIVIRVLCLWIVDGLTKSFWFGNPGLAVPQVLKSDPTHFLLRNKTTEGLENQGKPPQKLTFCKWPELETPTWYSFCPSLVLGLPFSSACHCLVCSFHFLCACVIPQQQNVAMGSLAQISSGAIRCSFNTRFRARFRRVPEGSGADTCWGSGGFRCR